MKWLKRLLAILSDMATKEKLGEMGVSQPLTFSTTFSATGYDRETAMRDWLDKYKKVCEEVVVEPDLVKSDLDGDGDLETKCNFGLQRICGRLGYSDFAGLLANQIVGRMEGEWREDTWERCVQEIGYGAIAVAGKVNPTGPGHVAAIYPQGATFSGKWGKDVPMCANVGNKNGIMGVNFAFSEEPRYFWKRVSG